MFNTKLINIDNPFIRTLQIGVVIDKPKIQICKIYFDERHYNDKLFEIFSIYCPKILSSASIKRKSEYLAARIATKYLFRRNNIMGDVQSNIDRSPKWPVGWSGSISHSDQCAIVVISPQMDAGKKAIIGVDIEVKSSKLDIEISNFFTTLGERKLLQAIDIDLNTALLIVFSAKESLFKAIYPQIKKYIGFESAIISQLSIHDKKCVFQLTSHLSNNFPIGYSFTGKYSVDKNHITTLIYEII